MSRRTNVISYIVSMVATLGALFVVVSICNSRYSQELLPALIKLLVGAMVSGLFNSLVHELGHLIAGKANEFVFSEMNVWFFRWKKVKNKIRFNLVMMGEEAGYTDMVPKHGDNLSTRLKKMTLGGIVASAILTVVGIVPLFIVKLPVCAFCIWSMFLPISAYFFFTSMMPSSSGGVRNDGAVIYGLKKMDDVAKVTVNLLKIQAELYNGKTPSEIDESLYFDLPQLPEDDVNFAMLLNARYTYYLDKKDFENASKTTDRLLSVLDYVPKAYRFAIQTDALYNACTFDYNENTADDLAYELEKFLNNVNTATNVRAKLAYLLYVRKEKESAEAFYKKGIRESKKYFIKGLGEFERKLFEEMKKDF
ncbi:MAG: hypothetical protein IKB67_00490 [Clostridia bacterium]|nr:hypothetical protein [Clostridia bacterium]